MGFFDFMIGEDKGMECEASTGADGTVRGSCRRFVKDKKSGEMLEDGQSIDFFINPNNCAPVVERGRVLDRERKKFDEEVSRFAIGCNKQIPKKGLTRG